MVVHAARDADPTRRAGGLQAYRDDNAVAMQVAALSDHVAHVDAEAEAQPGRCGQAAAEGADLALHGQRKLDGAGDALERH